MTYAETLTYLYNQVPMFQNKGAGAYKAGLETSLLLDQFLNNPHKKFKTIHIAGTNGKGSCSHTIAAVLQTSGKFKKVGLYTSPHLVDFRERFRINGNPMSKDFVVDFISKNKTFFEPLQPSFFELTTAMSFAYFAQEEVDIAVIEVGLGGRLDCTNIITPILSVITNISKDHTAFLGNSLADIAKEKAGIIKPNVPVIIGETTSETKAVFLQQAKAVNAPIFFAEEEPEVLQYQQTFEHNKGITYLTKSFGTFTGVLQGDYQIMNTNTLLKTIIQLKAIGIDIATKDVWQGFQSVCTLTNLQGRWQVIQENPYIVCDTGHNVAGITKLMKQLTTLQNKRQGKLHIVFGMVNDKDIQSVLSLLPTQAIYYFTQASNPRAIPLDSLTAMAQKENLRGKGYSTIEKAYKEALSMAQKEDIIFVGGSTFVVADFLGLF